MNYKYVFMFVGLAVVTGIICYFWKQVYNKKQILIASQKVVTSEAKTNRSINFTS